MKKAKTKERFIKHMAEMVEKYGASVLKEVEDKNTEADERQ
jgi:hypothetical protein